MTTDDGPSAPSCRLAALLTAVGLLWWPGLARAYEEQGTVSLSLGYGHAVSDSAPAHGALVDVAASVGLDDVFALRGRLSYALHPDEVPLHVFQGAGELLYLVDIFELVPYLGGGATGLGGLRDGGLGGDFGLHTVFGVDYLLSRELAVGFDFRSVFLLSALDSDPVYLAAGLSLTWMFEL